MNELLRRMRTSALVAAALALAMSPLVAQTPVELSDNDYTPAEDVQLGREAAAEVERQLPLLRDDEVNTYVRALGRRLVGGIPGRLEQPAFQYAFTVVNVRDLNAFALPGGPIYINRGMIEAARTEGELAGVLAHEASHVVLRHGTARATRSTPFALGALAGSVVGAILGGDVGSIVSQGTQFGLGTWFLSYSREFEREADLLGAQIMARTGYDPREAARMFETLERANGGGGLEFLSSHPNPGNRSERIIEEARLLGVRDGTTDTASFRRIKARLAGMPEAPTTAQVTGD
jgi:predicted Zn-dependent protease